MYHYEFKRNRLQSWRQNNDLAIKEVANSSSVAEQSHFQPSFIPGCHPPARAASCKVRCCHGSRHPEERLRALPRAEGIRMDRYSHSDEKQTCFLSCPLASFPSHSLTAGVPLGEQSGFCHNSEKLLPLYYHHENHLDVYAW